MSISLSSHVLDTTLGKPAANMKLQLTTHDGQVIEAQTDDDGRCNNWSDFNFVAGQYCLRFYTKEYLLSYHKEAFYPFVDVHFELIENGGHYHVPLLISPFGFSSYRGS
ncbi:hydroxyisourate hydrolase [Paraglaciecola arctica]|uniref:hydroxyisourate hydrolase n=1 Tax=Paraglaciecola arctica TaxID=1128911 RepID=UPI001C078FFB|nr:hydroxyisourate hydrolase [Paraglaciecola arctica]MBU3003571.1 hydroxyisourate hydrolase [Paraglaciecola arctica]